MAHFRKYLVLLVVSSILLTSYQNCSNTGFGVNETAMSSSSSSSGPSGSTPGDTAPPTTSSGGAGTGGGVVNALNTQTPGTWSTLANSKLSSVIYNGAYASALEGNSGPAAIMNAWAGGVLDSVSSQLLVWGGGHQDYFGNEMYSFSLNTLMWTRLTEPSNPSGWSGATGVMPDGAPSAPHTYDGQVFLPSLNKMFFVGGMDKSGGVYNNAWFFDPAAKSWTKKANYSGGNIGYGQIAGYDSNTGNVYVASNSSGSLSEFNPSTNTWKNYSSSSLPDYHMSGDVDPIGKRLVAVGSGQIAVYALSGSIGQMTRPTTTGDRAVELNGNAPGFAWYPPGKVFVGWDGGSNIYTLDPTTWKWTLRPLVAGNTVVPTKPNGQGTFGRFQYDPVHNIFIVVNGIGENVYFYKPNF